VKITIYDPLGNVVNNLVNANQLSGKRSIQWNATNSLGHTVAAGIYIYRIESGGTMQTKKMVFLK